MDWQLQSYVAFQSGIESKKFYSSFMPQICFRKFFFSFFKKTFMPYVLPVVSGPYVRALVTLFFFFVEFFAVALSSVACSICILTIVWLSVPLSQIMCDGDACAEIDLITKIHQNKSRVAHC